MLRYGISIQVLSLNRSIIRRKINKEDIIVHEDYKKGRVPLANDIALIRINESIPLYFENPYESLVEPIIKNDHPWPGLEIIDFILNFN